MESIINHILRAAKSRGFTQKVLAQKAGISQEAISRMKRQGNPTLDVVRRLADAAGVHILVTTDGRTHHTWGDLPEQPQGFKKKHKLVWSNSKAGDEVHLRAALLKPRFDILLDAAVEFGIDRLETEWALVRGEGSDAALKAEPVVVRTLRNIRNGYQQAQT